VPRATASTSSCNGRSLRSHGSTTSAGVLRPMAVQAIREADGNVKLATVIAKKRVSADDARRLLSEQTLREVLDT